MNYTFPFTIESGQGEIITFKNIIKEPDGDKIVAEATCTPHAGPAMHVHYRQDEGHTVMQGTMGCQIYGQAPVYYQTGQEAVFLRGLPHRFWNAGDDELHLKSWAKPANSIVFFLSTLFAAQLKSGSHRPELFDAAYLLMHYKREYGMPELPVYIRNILMPVTYSIGNLLGKYKKFKDAPEPLK